LYATAAAANGRIIDGSIIEVSLVDRPANPNAKLILAKSVDGESTLVRVEDARLQSTSTSEDIQEIHERIKDGNNSAGQPELAKSLTTDTVKFDQQPLMLLAVQVARVLVAEATRTWRRRR
jgi:hypothetical protein